MHILVVHQHYLAPGQPGGSRFNEMARYWCEAGHEVTIVAGTLNYATGEIPAVYRGKLMAREHDGPVNILRCYVPATYMTGYAGRMAAFAGFTASATTAVMRLPRPDVIIATSPPLPVVVPGWIAAHAHLRAVPWIFEMRDLWPESAVTTGVLRASAPLTKALYALERWACSSATRINVLTPAFRDDLLRRHLCPPEKIVFVPNGADVDKFVPGPRDNDDRRALGWGDRFVVMYAGAHGRANALSQLIDAAERLRTRPDILIACVGDGPERLALASETVRRGLSNIVFHGALPKARMPGIVRACDVGTAVLQDNQTFRTVYPNKVFDYMACERPILLGIDGAARNLVCDEAHAGVFAEPEHGEALAAAIVRLAADPEGRLRMGRAGRVWVLANATRESLAAKYLAVLQDLVRST